MSVEHKRRLNDEEKEKHSPVLWLILGQKKYNWINDIGLGEIHTSQQKIKCARQLKAKFKLNQI